MDWIRENKDWLITLAVFLAFVVLAMLTGIFSSGNGDADKEIQIEEEASIELPSSPNTNDQHDSSKNQTTSFFLHPEPTELLQKLEQLPLHELRSEAREMPGLKVMWPAYFFSIVQVEAQKATVQFDTSEDGFGAILSAEIDLNTYPKVVSLKKGQKVWLAGEIIGVDITGTGQFMLRVEYVRFDDFKPRTRPQKSSSNSQGSD